MVDGISGKDVAFYICQGLKHAVTETTNSARRSCRRRRTHPAVVQEIDDWAHHFDSVFTDVVNPPTVPSLSISQHLKHCPRYSCHLLLH